MRTSCKTLTNIHIKRTTASDVHLKVSYRFGTCILLHKNQVQELYGVDKVHNYGIL